MHYIVGGKLLNKIAKHEANEQILARNANQMKDIQHRVETIELDSAGQPLSRNWSWLRLLTYY